MMKDNKEFLQGIYEKAKVLEEEKFNKKKRYKNFLQYSSVAALLILIPFLAFKDQILKPNPINFNEVQPNGIRMMIMESDEYFSQADYIVLGQQLDYGSKRELYIEIQKSFLGNMDGLIELRDSQDFGGKRVLLFLKKEGDSYSLLNEDSYFTEIKEGVFQDNLGNRLSIQDIEDNIRRNRLK